MGFFGFLLNSLGTLAIDTVAALINGPPPTVGKALKDKSFKSNAYGNPIPRCRGLVRNQGQYWWINGIQVSWWKTTSGGIFGIGQKSVYVPYYSLSMLIGLGEKLGGGAATRFQKIWLDGKLLYDGVPSSAVITGAIVTSTILGGQPAGQQYLLVDLPSGAVLTLYPGNLIEFPADPGFAYQVQQQVSITGPQTQVPIPVWPPLRVNVTGGGALTVVGINSPVWDLSSFDPNPHDGSHFDQGYFATPGGVTFYYGSATDPADPTIASWLGVGHVPGYTGRVKMLIRNLQLKNYGNHPPQPSAEIAYDTITGAFPSIGPIAGVNTTLSSVVPQISIPYSAASAVNMLNPLKPLPYIWVCDNGNFPENVYRVNTQTNTMEAEMPVNGINNSVPIPADTDGFLYVSGAGAPIYKYDGLQMKLVAQTPGNISDSAGVAPWDQEVSLFGNSYLLKLLSAFEVFGGMYVFDRNTMLPYGTAGGGSSAVIVAYEQSGGSLVPIESVGTGTSSLATPFASFVSGLGFTVDVNGNFWIIQKNTLSMYNNQWQSGVYLDPTTKIPKPVLYPPSWARTDYNISSIVGSSGGQIYFNPGDNTIIVVGSNIGKVDLNGNILATISNPYGSSVSPTVDMMGTLLLGISTLTRFDVNTMTALQTYPSSSWGLSFGSAQYDQLVDSLWVISGSSPNLYRVLLDRANGNGLGLDSIVSSLMTDAGYTSGEFDVTQLTAAGITCGGVEFERESFLDSLKKLMQLYLFDAAEIDSKIVFVPRGQAPVLTIPESDLGVLTEPQQYEPRLVETVQDELDTPQSVWVRYYDTLKQDQQSVQYSKRLSGVYPSSLVNAKPVTNTKQRLDIDSPVTDGATPIKTQTDKILWDLWAGRPQRKAKLPFGGTATAAYWRLDPTDVVDFSYKSQTLETRLEECDLGASLAVEITGRNQDRTVYTNTNIPVGSSGNPSGGAPIGGIQNPNGKNNYTISPPYPLSSPNSTTIDIAAFSATFADGTRTQYAARTGASAITVPNPGSGLSAIYYVTIADPTFIGEPSGTPTLTVFDNVSAAAAFVGIYGYIFVGAVTVLGAGATTTSPNPLPGGQPPANLGTGPTLEVPFGPTAQSAVAGFQVAHGLGSVPSNVQIQIVPGTAGAVGEVWFQAVRYDAVNVYLVASAAGIEGYLEIWE